MMVKTLFLVYITGGLTFIPLVLAAFLAFAYVTLTRPTQSAGTAAREAKLRGAGTSACSLETTEKSKAQYEGSDVAAAYFAVCREYVPGGINGKPPERSTPAGEVLVSESPSVYQSMYRSIFDRGKTQIPSIEGDKKDGKVTVKKARNVFFVVLRHGHLMLFDDSEQVEVRHVISLTHHTIDIYAGGEPVGESDLFTKRNCIRLIRKPTPHDTIPQSQPFFFFSDNCSEKEDFYHALLLAQSTLLDADPPPLAQRIETPDIIKLVQLLHGSDADNQTRWLNALLGRVFLAMYKTKDVEDLIRAKINRKIARVSKPNFITAITIQDIDMGDSAPVISNPKLKELNINGDMTVELDIRYNGGFKIQMGAVARIDLGTRFKAREVEVVMAGVLRKLSGHLLIRVKPPPSNRLWITFETMPQLEMSIEPIVSSRQITYGVILRAIESRIREVIGETIVLPNWDDSPFLDTSQKQYRGGIWARSTSEQQEPKISKSDQLDAGVLDTAVQELVQSADCDADDAYIPALVDTHHKTLSMPSLVEPVQKLNLRKAAKKSVAPVADDSTGVTTGISTIGRTTTTPSTPPSRARSPSDKPKPLRSNSFASAATPLVSTEGVNIEAVRSEPKKRKGHRDAVELVKEVKSRSESGHFSPNIEPYPDGTIQAERDLTILPGILGLDANLTGPSEEHYDVYENDRRSSEPVVSFPLVVTNNGWDTPFSKPTASSTMPIAISSPGSLLGNSASQSIPHSSHLNNATAAAKKWGWQVLNRAPGSSASMNAFGFNRATKVSTPISNSDRLSSTGSTQAPDANALKAAMLAQPIGRGQPLPPPGMPLPRPQQRSLWASSPLNLGGPKRKPVPPPALPAKSNEQAQVIVAEEKAPPLPARRRHSVLPNDTSLADASIETTLGGKIIIGQRDNEVFVVAAPLDDESVPSTPASGRTARLQPNADSDSESGPTCIDAGEDIHASVLDSERKVVNEAGPSMSESNLAANPGKHAQVEDYDEDVHGGYDQHQEERYLQSQVFS